MNGTTQQMGAFTENGHMSNSLMGVSSLTALMMPPVAAIIWAQQWQHPLRAWNGNSQLMRITLAQKPFALLST